MIHRARLCAYLSFVILASTALTVAGACYSTGDNSKCCGDYTHACPPAMDEQGHLVYWNCVDKSDVTGWSVQTVTGYRSGYVGRDNHTRGDTCGSCKITPYTCGNGPNECSPGTAVPYDCANEVLTGNPCP